MAESEPAGGEGVARGQIRLERLYLKDASFESPRSPAVFGESWKPEMQLDINTRTNPQDGDRFEVVLTVTLRAKLDDGRTAYIIEVQHCLLYTSPSPRDQRGSRMPSSA